MKFQLVVLHVDIQVFQAPFVKVAVYSPNYILASLLRISWLQLCGFISGFFYSVSLVYLSVFVPVSYCFCYHD
jgi:uncharacterized membrane protein YbhN (UPF0104 family)